ncbi:MAG: response regulator [Bacteroidia bacterium]|nr:response regulator [Bacteroidia bacterium]
MQASLPIIRNLRIVFVISSVILLFSLFASVYSIQNLINSSSLVTHTYDVLFEAEGVISKLRDAETSQRGYLLTKDQSSYTKYEEGYSNVLDGVTKLRDLTLDNPKQQKNIQETKVLIEEKFRQMEKIVNITKFKGLNGLLDSTTNFNELLKGKRLMTDIEIKMEQIKREEKQLMIIRTAQLNKYSNYTPVIMVIAAIISLLITVFAFNKIKFELDSRLLKQLEDESLYKETKNRISYIENVTNKIAEGYFETRSSDNSEDEIGRISVALNNMAVSLESNFNKIQRENWLKEGAVKLGDAIRGERNINTLTSNLLSCITEHVKAPFATIYLSEDNNNYKLAGSYAAADVISEFNNGEGLLGQVALNRKILIINDIPQDAPNIISSMIDTPPVTLVIVPLIYQNNSIGILELGFLKPPRELHVEFLELSAEPMAIGLNAAMSYLKLQNLLEETQTQAEELQSQHEELEHLNSELEAQAQNLHASEEELKVQQEELQQTNGELKERTSLLEEKNIEIQRKAEELALNSKYKSEFLANMSHELRTPLNSILLLSRLLSENNEKNLTGGQVEYAKVIQSSGNGLLNLIDEILDLSKIESGKMEMEYLDSSVDEIVVELKNLFNPLAKEKGLTFDVVIDKKSSEYIETDKVKVGQILKNLISNALKFTAEGSVELSIENKNSNTIKFTVSDTGIGISESKQKLVFEAFQQADGSTKRQFGGTGLGLSISRELVKLLGGEISLKSEVGKGSEFTVLLPVNKPEHNEFVANSDQNNFEITKSNDKENELWAAGFRSETIPADVEDDRETVNKDDRTILIIEDDTDFAKILLGYTRNKGYKGIVAVRGDEGILMAEKYKPVGILLDIQLPIKSGWEVMDSLKNNPVTRHIPVHIMSSHKVKNKSLLRGAVDFIDKPVAFEQLQDVFNKLEFVLNRKTKKVLIVEENPKHAKALSYFLESFKINSEVRENINESIEALKTQDVDCVILDMGIPDIKAYEMLEAAKNDPALKNLPIIIFTGKSLSLTEEQKIKKYADSIVVKTANSYQRMLDEVSLFLHLVEGQVPAPAKTSSHRKLGILNEVLEGKKILVVDDDVRNIFSLSKSLEKYKVDVVTAIDGREALEKLSENPGIDVVLLDMMMPGIDGYETARQIRKNTKYKKLPVIAVTAKAMCGDREKCISAGASDYITKPVDIDQLISLLRVWLYERK